MIERSPRWRSDQIHVRRGSGCRIVIVVFVKSCRTRCSPAAPIPQAMPGSAVNSDIHRSRTSSAVIPAIRATLADLVSAVLGSAAASAIRGGAGPRRRSGGAERTVSVTKRA